MSTRAETPEGRYAKLVASFIGTAGVTQDSADAKGARGFGSSALKVNSKIFAMLTRGSLVVKLPRARVDELVAAGEGEPFDAGKGRPMKEWLTVTTTSSARWRALALEAMEFVASKA